MRPALDNHYSPTIAAKLRDRGHDVVAAVERGWEVEPDDVLLLRCLDEQRALLTNNVADFAALARRWAAEGRSHAGLVFTSDTSMPRGRATIGRYVRALDDLLRATPGPFIDRVRWL